MSLGKIQIFRCENLENYNLFKCLYVCNLLENTVIGSTYCESKSKEALNFQFLNCSFGISRDCENKICFAF